MAKEANKEKKEKKNFFKEFKAELKRVSWPTFKQLVNNTTAVLTIVLITAVIVFFLDVIFENLNNYGIEGLKLLVKSDSSEELVLDDEDILFDTDGAQIEEDNAVEGETESELDNDLSENADDEVAENENTV